MRYLFGELLYIISSHSKRPISLFVDDIQFADHSSLLLIRNLLFRDAKYNSSVFFVFCHRDNDPDYDSATFDIWLSSISMFSLEKIKLNNMNIEGVNSLVSDALHLSPRITRQLSEVLHHKTMGNPLFVKQLLASLTAQGYIYVDMSQPRWAWDLNKIADQEISESVLALLVDEMERLPSDLQLGLKLASCLGSCVQNNVLDILSKDLGIDLLGILQQVSEKGFMSNEDGMMFSFTHDKIQQAGE
jgi:predicted ATPase